MAPGKAAKSWRLCQLNHGRPVEGGNAITILGGWRGCVNGWDVREVHKICVTFQSCHDLICRTPLSTAWTCLRPDSHPVISAHLAC